LALGVLSAWTTRIVDHQYPECATSPAHLGSDLHLDMLDGDNGAGSWEHTHCPADGLCIVGVRVLAARVPMLSTIMIIELTVRVLLGVYDNLGVDRSNTVSCPLSIAGGWVRKRIARCSTLLHGAKLCKPALVPPFLLSCDLIAESAIVIVIDDV
jgi:hypothetical protein